MSGSGSCARWWSTFLFFHAAAVVLDATERWERPQVALGMLAFAALLLWAPARVRRYADVAWLVGSAMPLLVLAPDLANHRNLTLYVNAVLLCAWAAQSLRTRAWAPFDDALFAAVTPVLRFSVAVVYFFAGFHKLNGDFLLEPEVSCAGVFVGNLGQQWFGAGAPVLPAGAWVGPVAFAVVAWELASAFVLPLSAPNGRLRRVTLCGAWALHGVLALSGFYDFSALMFALLWTFVPPSLVLAEPGASSVAASLERTARQGASWVLAGGLVAGLILFAWPSWEPLAHLLQGALLDLALLRCAVPLLFAWRALPQPVLAAPSTAAVPIGRGLWLAPAALALFASSNYLGLRTAGTFSMFSNLRTEGGFSNHLLIPADHPLVIGTFQRDLVWIDALDTRALLARDSLAGMAVPRVELERHLATWRAGGASPVRAIIRDEHGIRHDLPDLTRAAAFIEPRHPWAMRLLDFRPVQPDPRRPNACRW